MEGLLLLRGILLPATARPGGARRELQDEGEGWATVARRDVRDAETLARARGISMNPSGEETRAKEMRGRGGSCFAK